MKCFKFKILFLYAALLSLLVGCASGLVSSAAVPPPSSAVSAATSQPPPPKEKHIVPDGQLVKLYSQREDATSLIYTDENQTDIYSVSYPIISPSDVFVSSEVIAVVKGDDETTITGAVSHDGGATWVEYEIPIALDFIPYHLSYNIGFSSPQEGWIIWEITDNSTTSQIRYTLFQSHDGGATWELRSTFSIKNGRSFFCFASPEVGWTSSETEGMGRRVLETFDGGKTWAFATMDIPEEMNYGELLIDFQAPRWEDGRWCMTTMGFRRNAHPTECVYTFVWQQETETWVWDNPRWDIPEGISQIDFIDYMQNYAYPPIEYDSSVGFGFQPDIWLYFNAKEHLIRVGKENKFGPVTFEILKEVTQAMYGGNTLNIPQTLEYWDELYDIEYTDEAIIDVEMWFSRSYDTELFMYILSAATNPDGSIEVILKRRVFPRTMMGRFTLEKELSIRYQKCIFVPTTLDGIQYFTLMSSKEISYQEAMAY